MLEPGVLFDALQTVSDAVLIAGPGGEIRWTNAAFTALTGYGADEVAGKNPRLLKSGAHDAAFYHDLWTTILAGRPWSGEMTNRRKDGSVYQEFQTITPVKDAAGNVTCFVAVKRDLTRERACEEREAILRTTLDGFVIVDGAGRILETNDSYCRMSGYSRQELLRMRVSDLEADETPEEIQARASRIAARGHDRFETRHRRKDGGIVELDVSVNHLPCPGRFCVFLRDITGRRRAEQAILSIFDALESPIYVSDPQTHEVLFVNRSLRGALGRDPVGGKCYEQLQARETPCPFCNNDVLFAEGGGTCRWRFDNPVLGRTYELTDQIIDWPDGRRVRLEFAFDVTDRVRAEEALRNAHQLLDTVVEAAPVAIVALDADLRVRRWNRAAERISGWRADEVLGRTLPAPLTPEREAAMARVQAGETVAPVEFTTHRRDGSPFEISASGAPLRDAAGEFDGMVIIAEDVSGRKRLEAQLIQAQKLECVGRLAGGVAHDFNNLLTIINGYADLIMMQTAGGANPLHENAAEIKAAGERAIGLTRQLLTFSRKQVMQPCLLDLNALVGEAQRMLRRLIGEDVEIEVELAAGLGRVKADPGLLHQALVNLAVNARDAMPEGGRLTIRTGSLELADAEGPLKPGRYVTLSVSDTGVGMDANTRAHLFEPFFTTKPVGRGTGLGLCTVYGVVQQADGHILVESQPGKGATFRICLPRAAEPETPGAAPPQAAAAHARGNETVLVMEDQAEVRRLVCSSLGRFGYRVLEAAGGPQALALAESHDGPIHLLLADVVMPGMSGREAAQRLSALRPAMKVLYMSGYTEEVISHRGVLEAGVAYIAKPFTPEALAAKVRAVLGDSLRVLVADDESAVRGLLRAVLTQAGYEVAEAADGREALAAVDTFHPHVVLLDLVMPGQEGIETMRVLSRAHPKIKIVAMSGAFTGSLLEGTMYLGAHATLAKPISRDALLETIRGLE